MSTTLSNIVLPLVAVALMYGLYGPELKSIDASFLALQSSLADR